MLPYRSLRALEEVGNPADAAFRQRNLEIGKVLPERRKEPVCRAVGDRDRHRGAPRADWRQVRRVSRMRPGSDMSRQNDLVIVAHLPTSPPFPAVNAPQADHCRVVWTTAPMHPPTQRPP